MYMCIAFAGLKRYEEMFKSLKFDLRGVSNNNLLLKTWRFWKDL